MRSRRSPPRSPRDSAKTWMTKVPLTRQTLHVCTSVFTWVGVRGGVSIAA